jgi:hypothetical protein
MNDTSKFTARTLAVILLVAASTGCARWQPEANGPIQLTRACPLQNAPAVTDYGAAGVYAMYHYVIQDASGAEVEAFKTGRTSAGFAVAAITLNINGKDTLFVRGARAMRSQGEVDEEFNSACRAGYQEVYLTHVFYQPFDSDNSDATSVRVR